MFCYHQSTSIALAVKDSTLKRVATDPKYQYMYTDHIVGSLAT